MSGGLSIDVDPQTSNVGTTKKLARGISRATENANIITHVRSQLSFLVDTSEYTFSLPDLSVYPNEFREFLEKDLIEGGCLTSLEAAGRLNWWCSKNNRILWPLATTGDGNCLLHAASLGMWGYHDRLLTLRDALYNILFKGEYKDAIFRRWKWRQLQLNAIAGLAYSETEWITEWHQIVEMASANPRSQTDTYQSLEEVHILALAYVLRRPIIVIAETMLRDHEGTAIAPIPFGGIYLPLDIPPNKCHRTPLFLAYHSAHFSPLVTVDFDQNNSQGVSIPIIDPDTGQLLPILFAVDPGPDWDWKFTSPDLLPYQQETMEILVRDYLDCEYEILMPDDLDRLADSDGFKSKTTKQLLEVAKSFGSIGKSMSKKFFSMTKRPKSPPLPASNYSNYVLCVKIKSRRHEFVDQMLQNYLQSAHSRYLEKNGTSGCEMNYGAGKSKFYTASDTQSHSSVNKLQPSNLNRDRTLYLSKSTFYNTEILNDKKPTSNSCRQEDCDFFGSPERDYYCSKCWAKRQNQISRF